MFKEKDECCRGDLYYAVLDPVVGSEQGGVRPVLIIQNDIGNHRSSTVIAAPLTSRVGEKSLLPTHVEVPPLGRLKTRSLVLLEQLRTLDKSRLDGYVGHLDPRRMCHVDRALKISVGLVGAFNDSPSVRCLCAACAGRYYDDPAFAIRRADPCQSVRETCDFCGSRTGYDYIVRERKAKSERGGAENAD